MDARNVWTIPAARVWTIPADAAAPWLVTFSDVDDYVTRVDGAVKSLAIDVAAHPDKSKADPGLARAWAEWVAAWEVLKADIKSTGTRFFQAPATKYDEVEIKEKQFAEFRARWGKAGVQANAPAPGGPIDKPTGESSTTELVRLGLLVAGLAAGAYLIRG